MSSYTVNARVVQVKRDLDCKTTGVLVQAGPTQIVSLIVSNTTAATGAFFKIYDKATAPTTSDTPLKTIFLGANSTQVIVIQPRQGGELEPTTFQFQKGFGYRSVTGVADNDANSPASNGTVANIEFY